VNAYHYMFSDCGGTTVSQL